MTQLRIAVIGSGISGLSAAWLLSKRHKVTIYEADSRLGGHANTVDVALGDAQTPVDTGFIVYNQANYPNLTALFEHLGVKTHDTEMSFALSLDGGAYEYAGSGIATFFGQPGNLLRPSHWRLLKEIDRFFRTSQRRLDSYPTSVELGTFLDQEGYSRVFVEDHIVPMGAAIWSTTMAGMLQFPARNFVDFYANHGMLQFRDRIIWRSVKNGSRSYVSALTADAGFEVLLNQPAARLHRKARQVLVEDSAGTVRPFDHVVVATHADQARNLLADASPLESRLLGAFAYQKNRAVLHTDDRLMPRRRRLWSSWNYLKNSDGVERDLCVTYWMNRLQDLSVDDDLFVTLNPSTDIDPSKIVQVFDYDHPVFSSAAMAAQKALWALQGVNRTWFCGSYFGYGFHEDGIQSGLAVAEQLGGERRPWHVESESCRIHLGETAIRTAAQ